MSIFRDALGKAIADEIANEEKITKAETGERPKLKELPMNGGPYLMATYGFLITVFLLLYFFGTHTIFNSDYGTTIGTYNGEDLYYSANGQEIIKKDSRDYSYSYRTNNRKKGANSSRFFIQVINYKKDNPNEFVFTFGLGGDLNDLGHTTFHNNMLLFIIFSSIINFFFYRWGMRGGLKRYVERGLYAAQLRREARLAKRKSDKNR